MKKLTIVLTGLMMMFALGLNAQDLNDAGKAYNKGIELAKDNKTFEAIKSYMKCSDISAKLGDVGEGLKSKAENQISSLYMKLGIDAYKAKEQDSAIALFKLSKEYANKVNDANQAAKAVDFIATTYVAQGNDHYKSKKYEEAIASFNNAIEYNPEYFKAYYGLAICYNKKEDTQGLEEAVNNVIKYGGEDDVVEKARSIAATYFLNLSGKALQAGNNGEAAMMAKKCISYDYMQAGAYYYEATAQNNLKNWDEAIKAATTGLKAEKEDQSNLYFELGRAYEGKGDSANACESYGNVSSGPNVAAANYQRVQVLKCE